MIVLALIATALIAFRFWRRITALDASITDLKFRVQELEQRHTSKAPQPKAADEVRTPPVAVTPALLAPPARPPQPVVVQPPPGPAVETPRGAVIREPGPVVSSAPAAQGPRRCATGSGRR